MHLEYYVIFSCLCNWLNIGCILNIRVIYEFGLIMRLYFSSMRWWCIFGWQYVIFMGSMMGVFALLRMLDEIKCCVRFSVPRNPVKTFSPVWSSGRGLVRVLYPLTCVKQWGGERCFSLFRLVASIVPDVRCIDVFTHNSFRDKGDSLTALSRRTPEPSVLGN